MGLYVEYPEEWILERTLAAQSLQAPASSAAEVFDMEPMISSTSSYAWPARCSRKAETAPALSAEAVSQVPPEGFEPPTYGTGNRRSIP